MSLKYSKIRILFAKSLMIPKLESPLLVIGCFAMNFRVNLLMASIPITELRSVAECSCRAGWSLIKPSRRNVKLRKSDVEL